MTPSTPSTEDIVLFVTELARSKSFLTVKAYLAAVRHYIILNGGSLGCLQSPQLSYLLRGIERHQRARPFSCAPTRRTRRAITTADLDRIRTYIDRTSYGERDRSMLWAAITSAFHGLLRSAEYTAPTARSADALRTLTWRQVTVEESRVVFNLNVTKTRQLGNGDPVIISATGNSRTCPVDAIKAYRRSAQLTTDTQCSLDYPFFRFSNGRNLTREDVTRCLRLALHCTDVSSHSLRSGGATALAQQGARDWEIRASGRWASQAYLRYILPDGSTQQR